MSAMKRLIGFGGAAAFAFGLGVAPAAADDDDRGGRKWKHHKNRHHYHRYYEPQPEVVVIERHYRRPPPRIIYVEPAPIYSRPEINIVFPLRF